MQWNGRPLEADYAASFTLPRRSGEGLVMRLKPLPLGFQRKLRQRGLSQPLPPVRVARDPSGRPLRDGQGQVVSVPDAADARYQEELERYHQRVAALSFHQSVAEDASLCFETLPPAGDAADWGAFADRLLDEMEQAGFTAGDLTLICREICRISNLLDEHLTTAQANFSLSPASDSG